MSRIKSVYSAIERVEVKDQYSACLSNFIEIKERSNGYFDALYDSFRFGYLQGMKALKAEMRQGRMVNGSKSR